MYQFDTTAEIGKNIYLKGNSLIGYKCNFAIKYYDEEYNYSCTEMQATKSIK